MARRRFLTVGALTLALGTAITVVQNVEFGGGDPKVMPTGTVKAPKRVLGPVADAADFADRAAAQAATEPAWTIRPDQWSYVKDLRARSSKGVGGSLFGPPDRRVTIESWKSADGKKTAGLVKGKVKISGQPQWSPGSSPRMDYPFLIALPTDPVALRDFVFEHVRDEAPGQRLTEDELAARSFEIIEIWMRGQALPPAIRAALYGALAKLPGVKYEAKAADLAGRKGATLYRIEEGYLRSRKGQILGWGALLKTAIVDEPGQRP